jgi:hypothetical protein
MDEHVFNWLSAYCDGELELTLQNRVRDHLEVCAECRHELTSLEDLSNLLRSQAIEAPDPVKEAARLEALLPNLAETPESHTSKGTIWWFIPILLLIIALILQIATNMTLFMLSADLLSSGGGLAGLFPGWAHTTASSQSWSSLLTLSIEGNPAAILSLVGLVRQSVDFLFAGITWQLALALVYIAWLVAVWNKRSRLLAQSTKQMVSHSVSIGV